MKEYKDKLDIYKVYHSISIPGLGKYYVSVDFLDTEEIKDKKIAKERERKIDLILS